MPESSSTQVLLFQYIPIIRPEEDRHVPIPHSLQPRATVSSRAWRLRQKAAPADIAAIKACLKAPGKGELRGRVHGIVADPCIKAAAPSDDGGRQKVKACAARELAAGRRCSTTRSSASPRAAFRTSQKP